MERAQQDLRSLAVFYLAEDVVDPRSYRLNRLAAWLGVMDAPPETSGKTRIPAPPAKLANGLTGLASKENWEGLLRESEENISRYLFWWDLSYWTWQALSALGGAGAASQVVAAETRAFAQRFPAAINLCFADGTPFANEATRAWLREEPIPESVAALPEAEDAAEDRICFPQVVFSGGIADQIAPAYEAAQVLRAKKKLPTAVALLEGNLRAANHARERFLWRVALCRVLADSPQAATLVGAQAETLVADIKRYRLEAWEPELALTGLTLVHALLRRGGEKTAVRVTEIAERICRLSPAMGLSLNPEAAAQAQNTTAPDKVIIIPKAAVADAATIVGNAEEDKNTVAETAKPAAAKATASKIKPPPAEKAKSARGETQKVERKKTQRRKKSGNTKVVKKK